MNIPLKEVSGAILAGGKSTRMNVPKGLIQIDGKTLINSIMSVLQTVVTEAMIIANDPVYDKGAYPMYHDIDKGKGPASGIHSALHHAQHEKVLIVSCDVPFVSPELFQYLIDQSQGKRITVPVHQGKMEPLMGVYSRSILNELQECMNKGQIKMDEILKVLNVDFINVPGDLFSEKLFTNINTPEDLRKAFPEYGSL